MLGSGLTNRQVVSMVATKTSSKTRKTETPFLRTPEPHSRVQKPREFGICHANFLETLFNGSQSSNGSAKEQADELVSELLQILKKNKRGNKPYIDEDQRIAEIANDLQSFNVTRNPAKNSNLFGDYEVGYASRQITPPFAFNLRITFLENYEVVQAFDVLNLGLFNKTWKRFANFSPNGPKTYTLAFIRSEQDKGPIGGINVVEFDDVMARTFDIVHLDDRVLITRARSTRPEEVDSTLTILVRKGTMSVPKESVQSEISPGKGVSGQGRKITGATMAEKKYKKQFEQQKEKVEAENAAKQEAVRLQKEKAEAESAAKQAREEAARLEKEKASAEREAALKLKAEIKESVDGFGLRLKEAQANKKEAAAALKTFERENSDVLKEAESLRKKLDGFGIEIAGLTDEIAGMVEEEKQSASELRDCRQQLSNLERQLAAL